MTAYDQRPGYLLKRAEHALRLTMDRDLATVGLTTPQYAALSALEREAEISNAELARRCFVTPQTMHRLVETLGREALLDRADGDRGRGRTQRLRVTASGKATLRRAHRLVEAIEDRMVAAIDPAAVDTTVRTLDGAAEALNT